MSKKQTNVRLPESTLKQLDILTQSLDRPIVDVIALAVYELYRANTTKMYDYEAVKQELLGDVKQ